MTDVIISGANGKMGSLTNDIIAKINSFNITGLYDPNFQNSSNNYNDKKSLPDADLVIDFVLQMQFLKIVNIGLKIIKTLS